CQTGAERRNSGEGGKTDVRTQNRKALTDALAARHDAEERFAGYNKMGGLALQFGDDIVCVVESRSAPDVADHAHQSVLRRCSRPVATVLTFGLAILSARRSSPRDESGSAGLSLRTITLLAHEADTVAGLQKLVGRFEGRSDVAAAFPCRKEKIQLLAHIFLR